MNQSQLKNQQQVENQYVSQQEVENQQTPRKELFISNATKWDTTTEEDKAFQSRQFIGLKAADIAQYPAQKLAKVLAFLPENTTRELIFLTKDPKKQQFLMENTPHEGLKHLLAEILDLKMVIDGEDFTFASVKVQQKALEQHLKRLCLFFPNAGMLIKDLRLAKAIFERTYPFEITDEMIKESVSKMPSILRWLTGQGKVGKGCFPDLDNPKLPPLFVRAHNSSPFKTKRNGDNGYNGDSQTLSLIPNLAYVRKGVNLIAYPLTKMLEAQGEGKNSSTSELPPSANLEGVGLHSRNMKWVYTGNWSAWGYLATTGAWLNPRGRLSLDGKKWNPSAVLFGATWVNRCDHLDHLDLNPFHWQRRHYNEKGR
jgi:hypothetical protein